MIEVTSKRKIIKKLSMPTNFNEHYKQKRREFLQIHKNNQDLNKDPNLIEQYAIFIYVALKNVF